MGHSFPEILETKGWKLTFSDFELESGARRSLTARPQRSRHNQTRILLLHFPSPLSDNIWQRWRKTDRERERESYFVFQSVSEEAEQGEEGEPESGKLMAVAVRGVLENLHRSGKQGPLDCLMNGRRIRGSRGRIWSMRSTQNQRTRGGIVEKW